MSCKEFANLFYKIYFYPINTRLSQNEQNVLQWKRSFFVWFCQIIAGTYRGKKNNCWTRGDPATWVVSASSSINSFWGISANIDIFEGLFTTHSFTNSSKMRKTSQVEGNDNTMTMHISMTLVMVYHFILCI